MQAEKKMMTEKVKMFLNTFDVVGVAPRERFRDAPEEYHPKKLLNSFQSIIVFGEGGNAQSKEMSGFQNVFASIAAQAMVTDFLKEQGFDSVVVGGNDTGISLIQMGIKAGLGELSPVNSLVVKGFGLTVSLGAIITEAPLVYDEEVCGICIHCMKCVNICPATQIPYQRDKSKCGCGKCKNICPV